MMIQMLLLLLLSIFGFWSTSSSGVLLLGVWLVEVVVVDGSLENIIIIMA